MSTQPRALIHIPAPLRSYAGNLSTFEVSASTVGSALHELIEAHPALRQHLYDESGSLRSYVNIYLNDEDIRQIDREATAVASRDELSIVPSIAGG